MNPRLRRTLLFAASGVATSLCAVFWVIGVAKDATSAERVIVPTLTFLFGFITWMTWRGRLRYAELALLSLGGSVLLERLYFAKHLGKTGLMPVTDAYELFIWFPCVYVFAFLLLRKQEAVLFNLALLGGGMLVVADWLVPGVGQLYHADLTEFFIGQLGCIIVIYTFAYMKESLLDAHRLAMDMRSFAETDFLTGVPNRRALTAALEQEIKRSSREGTPLSVLILDLDRFKRINDEHGHEEGDRALRRVAMVVDRVKRDTDVFGRWGGEEFLMITPSLDVEHGVAAANRMRLLIAGSAGESGIEVTASFGVAEYRFGDGVASLVKRADEGLMDAKAAGRNCVRAVPD